MKKQRSGSAAAFGAFLDRPYVILVLAPLFWGGNMVAGKIAVGQIDPYLLIVLRWFGALLFVLPFALPHFRQDRSAILRFWPLLALYGMLGFTAFNILMYVSVYFTSAVNASIEQALIPVLVMLANFIVFRVRARLIQVAGVFLTIAGVAVTAAHGDLGRIVGFAVNFGDALVLLACIAYAIYSLALRFRPAMHWLSFLVTTFAFALLAGLVAWVVAGGGLSAMQQAIGNVTPTGWAVVLYVAFFPSVLSQLFYARGVELVGANRASLFINMIPVFGTVLSILVLGERLEAYHLVTALLVVAGIVLAEWSARRR